MDGAAAAARWPDGPGLLRVRICRYLVLPEVRELGFQPKPRRERTSNSEYLQHVLNRDDAEDEPVAPTVLEEHPITKPKAPAIVIPNRQDQSLIGRIEIPRVQVSAIVREGVDNKTLRRAVGHVPGTALPGKPGNIGLAGHRDTFFVGLRGIRKSDRIQLTTLDGDYTYEVDSIKIVTPRDVSVLASTNEPVLTLVTCYPFNYVGSAPKRYIVRAKQVVPAPGDLIEARSDQRPSLLKPRATRVSEHTRPVIRRAKVNNS